MNKSSKGGCCGGNCHCKHDSNLDLSKVKQDAEKLLKNAKSKYDHLKPEQKKKIKKEVAIGSAIALGLWGLKKMLGSKKKGGKGKKK